MTGRKRAVILSVVAAVLLVAVLAGLLVAGSFALSAASAASVPADAPRIVLDAGHGGVDPGVLGGTTGEKESDVNLKIVQKLEKLFAGAGFRVVLTRKNAGGLYGLPTKGSPDMKDWKEFLHKYDTRKEALTVALVGKYTEIKDAYLSVNEAVLHAGIANGVKVNIFPVEAEDLETGNVAEILGKADAILVPGGFGQRGVEGKIVAARYARENGVPYLGLCLGMQVAVIEFARSVLGFADANSLEMDESTTHPVIHLMEEQKNVAGIGGTSRLGTYPCEIKPGTKAEKIYGATHIEERHRHRFEFNNEYIKEFEAAGMRVAGVCPMGGQVEIMENDNHPWMVGVQFHPEFLSRPVRPHPLFKDFIAAALEIKKQKEAKKA